MQDDILTAHRPAPLGELEKAFGIFNRLSNELQSSYQLLQQRVAALTTELEEARRARQRAAGEAQRTAERLQSLIGTLPAGVVVVDEQGLIQEHNQAAADILGLDLLGSTWQTALRSALDNPLALRVYGTVASLSLSARLSGQD